MRDDGVKGADEAKMKRLIIAILAVCLLVPVTESQEKKTQKVQSLKGNLAKVRAKQSAVRKALRETKKRVRVVKGDIRQVDERLVTVEDKLQKTSSSLSENRKTQAQLAVELKSNLADLEAKRLEARSRIRAMYINGNASLASALVGVKSLGDVASRKYLLQTIAERDKKLFDSVADLCERVERQKKQQDQVVRRIGGLLVSQKEQQNELEDTRQDKKALLGQLYSKQAELEKIARQFDQEEASIQATIAAYMRGRGKNSGLTRPSGRLLMPVAGRIGSSFGMRFHPILKRNRLHKGVDIGAGSGTPIKSAADGVVITATYMRGYGNCLVVDHGGGVSTLYAHCSRLFVGTGARVKRGQRIAAVGSTGLSTGPHLHFEVHVNGAAVNPRAWL